MKIVQTKLNGVLILEPQVFGDHRGWFMESYSYQTFQSLGIDMQFVQDNHSLSVEQNVLRGLHFQNNPMAQNKLVCCTNGSVLDIAVDIRNGSPTYGKWVSVILSAENKKRLFIPKGFAHGFRTLVPNTEVQYKVDQYYAPEQDRSIRFDDPTLRIDWGGSNYILSDRDRTAPFLQDSDANFTYKG